MDKKIIEIIPLKNIYYSFFQFLKIKYIVSNIYKLLNKKNKDANNIILNYVLIDLFTHIIYIFGTFVFCEFIYVLTYTESLYYMLKY